MKLLPTLFALIIMLLGFQMSAQSIEEKQIPKLQKKSANDRFYVMTVKDGGIYTVKILNPRGDIQTSPVKKKKYLPGERVEFKLNTKFWMDGTYYIISENELGKTFTKKFRIHRKES